MPVYVGPLFLFGLLHQSLLWYKTAPKKENTKKVNSSEQRRDKKSRKAKHLMKMIAAGLDQSIERLVCYTAALRDDTKNGCVADYRALDRRVEGRGLDSRCRANTQLRNEGTHFAPQPLS